MADKNTGRVGHHPATVVRGPAGFLILASSALSGITSVYALTMSMMATLIAAIAGVLLIILGLIINR